MLHPHDLGSVRNWNIGAPCQLTLKIQWNPMWYRLRRLNTFSVRSKSQFCSKVFPTELRHSSCVAILFFNTCVYAFAACDTSLFSLPANERAARLGFGNWPITSTFDDFNLRDLQATSSSSKTYSFVGFPNCTITLENGIKTKIKDIKDQPYLVSYFQVTIMKMRVSLPHPLASLFMQVHHLD